MHSKMCRSKWIITQVWRTLSHIYEMHSKAWIAGCCAVGNVQMWMNGNVFTTDSNPQENACFVVKMCDNTRCSCDTIRWCLNVSECPATCRKTRALPHVLETCIALALPFLQYKPDARLQRISETCGKAHNFCAVDVHSESCRCKCSLIVDGAPVAVGRCMFCHVIKHAINTDHQSHIGMLLSKVTLKSHLVAGKL